ncbi:MAG TPA: serine protease [Polyangiaceae bacterium]|nr:serine protease [Polyangiaceae bacterium]
MKMSKRLGTTVSRALLPCVACMSFACGANYSDADDDEAVGVVRQETQCDDSWDAPDVELYDGSVAGFPISYVTRWQGAFGRHCSGSLIGPNLFLTVNHSGCNVQPSEVVGFNCQLSASDPNPPDPDAAAQARCQWFQATSVVQYAEADVSISVLAGNPGGQYGWVFPSPRVVAVDEPIAVFQHPLGRGRRKVVGFGSVESVDESRVHYRIDTTGGSSGAGVLDRQGLLVGIHKAGGCGTEGTGTNSAIPMATIFAAVLEIRGPVVAAWSSAVL